MNEMWGPGAVPHAYTHSYLGGGAQKIVFKAILGKVCKTPPQLISQVLTQLYAARILAL
jgi:hypothetical protein